MRLSRWKVRTDALSRSVVTGSGLARWRALTIGCAGPGALIAGGGRAMDEDTGRSYNLTMALPHDHLRSLESALQDHERRIEQLRADAQYIHEELALHEMLVELGRNEQIIAALAHFEVGSDVGMHFAENPARYCEEQGVRLPEGVTLYSPGEGNANSRLTGLVRSGAWEVEISWDRSEGFRAIPMKRPATMFPERNGLPRG